MKKIIVLLIIIGAVQFGVKKFDIQIPKLSLWKNHSEQPTKTHSTLRKSPTSNTPRDGSQFSGSGRVSRILSDDSIGSKHQRFILTLSSGRTILIAHNIDIAPRISSLNIGDTVSFNGVYEHNSKGGVVHWTHHDPNGRHQAGWLRKNGRTYQ
jgi:hypothetical protein